MSGLGNVMAFVCLTLSANAQPNTWQNVDNSCTQLTTTGSLSQITTTSKVEWWSLPSDKCISITITLKADGTHVAEVSVPPNDPKYSQYHTITYIIENPDKIGQFEEFPINGSSTSQPVRVLAIPVFVPKVGYALVICDFKSGGATFRRYVMSFPGATPEQMEDLKSQVEDKVKGLPLNKVDQVGC